MTFCQLLIVILTGVSACALPPVIPGYERLAATDRLREAGEVLLSELGCVRCHEAPLSLANRLPDYSGPDLSEVATRLRGDFIHDFLLNPAQAHPGTRMPDMLSQRNDREAAALALTAFLSHSSGIAAESRQSEKQIQEGRALYHTIGCVACHEPEKGYQPADAEEGSIPGTLVPRSVPLEHVSRKYRPGELTRFLLDPLKIRDSARMPAVAMTEQEARALEAYLTRDPAPAREIAYPSAAREQGALLFRELNCAACHAKEGAGDHGVLAKALGQLSPGPDSCLGAEPSPGLPRYSLTESQRRALEVALMALKEQTAPASTLDSRLAAMNCLACHSRNGDGGPGDRSVYFHSTGEDLGDEGRFPPPLDFAGAKFQPAALTHILEGKGRVRPYMQTRMPGFGAEHAASLTKLFVAADQEGLVPTIRPASAGRNALGRELVGNTGLNCITCHPMNGHRSLGIQSVDLATAPRRLRVEWFREHLLDPARFRPGTRMPSFWPGGKTLLPTAGSDAARQIEAIWVYLNELDQTRLPAGMEDPGEFELVPAERPIVFRTFMKHAGMHAIAVGFPEQRHLAFDARDNRLALLWTGAFLNAEGTWDDRFAPLAEPLGTNVIRLPSGPDFASLQSADERWPAISHSRFQGYRIDRHGVPVFLYEIANVLVEDRLVAESGGILRREIQLHLREGGSAPELWFRAGAAREIRQERGQFVLDGQWRTSLNPSVPFVRKSGNVQELLARVRFENGEAELQQEFQW